MGGGGVGKAQGPRPTPPTGMGTHIQCVSSAVMPLGTGLFGGGNAKDAHCRAPALGGWAEPSDGEERFGRGVFQAFPAQVLILLIQYPVWFGLFILK